MIIETLIGALVPVAAEGVKRAVGHFFGGVKPATIEEQLKLDQSDIERLRALAELDKPIGEPSQWVVDLRASARYVGALVVIAVGISTLYIQTSPEVQKLALEAANIAFGFLFGARLVAGWSKK